MIWIGILFAFIGFAFSSILMEDVLFFYRKLIADKLPEWLSKPLGLCNVCFTGQLSLWGLLPFLETSYIGLIQYFGIISINMIIVTILNNYVKTD